MTDYDKVTLMIAGDMRSWPGMIGELGSLALRFEWISNTIKDKDGLTVERIFPIKKIEGHYNYIVRNYSLFAAYIVSKSREIGQGLTFTLRLRSNPDYELRVCAGKAEGVERSNCSGLADGGSAVSEPPDLEKIMEISARGMEANLDKPRLDVC
ncbi:MAG: hypothetical protein AABX47_10165 [Nanoarchaeota archaeon]